MVSSTAWPTPVSFLHKLLRSTSLSSLEDSLVGHWTFDGDTISGTTVTDTSGNGNNGTLTGGPSVTTGRIGQAMGFDGNNDYVQIADSLSLRPGNNSWSVSAWIDFENVPTIQAVVGKDRMLNRMQTICSEFQMVTVKIPL